LWLKGLLAVAVAVVGSWLLCRIQNDMAKERRRLQTLLTTYYTPDELRGVGLTEKEISELRAGERYPWQRGWEFFVPLMAVLVVGAILVLLAL